MAVGCLSARTQTVATAEPSWIVADFAVDFAVGFAVDFAVGFAVDFGVDFAVDFATVAWPLAVLAIFGSFSVARAVVAQFLCV